MAIFAPQLSEATLDSQVLKCLITCQNDQIPTVRQNTTYVLAKIAAFLSESSREKFLLPSFARALKDPYPPARVASITSMGATLEFHHPPACAQKILPMLSMMCLDPEVTVRQAAIQCCQRVLAKLEAYSVHLTNQQAQGHQSSGGDKTPAATTAAPASGWLSYVSDVSQKVVTTALAGKTGAKAGETTCVTPSNATKPAAKPSSPPNVPSTSAPPSSISGSGSRPPFAGEAKKTLASVNIPRTSKSSSNDGASIVSSAKAEIDSSGASGWGDEDFFNDVADESAPTVDLSLSTKKKNPPASGASRVPVNKPTSKIAAISAEIADDPLGNWDAPTASAATPISDDSDPWGMASATVVKPAKPETSVKPVISAAPRPVVIPKKASVKATPVTITLPKPATASGSKMENWEDFLNS
jgi:hypothetical protein